MYYFTNGSRHEVPACYLELHEEGEVEISTCIWHKYKDMTAILKKSTRDKIIKSDVT